MLSNPIAAMMWGFPSNSRPKVKGKQWRQPRKLKGKESKDLWESRGPGWLPRLWRVSL